MNSALETELQDFLDHMSAYADAAIPEHQLRGVLARCRDALRSARLVVAEHECVECGGIRNVGPCYHICRRCSDKGRPVVAESADPYPKWTWGQKDREHALAIGIREIEARAKERGNPSCIEASVLKKMLDEVRARPVVAEDELVGMVLSDMRTGIDVHRCKGEKCEAWDDARSRLHNATPSEESAFVAGWHVHAERLRESARPVVAAVSPTRDAETEAIAAALRGGWPDPYVAAEVAVDAIRALCAQATEKKA